MKRTITLSLALIGVLFFTSCKREESISIDQNRIYSEYIYSYNASLNKSTVTARFRVDHNNGKKIELSYPSRVSFNGSALAWRNVLGAYEASQFGNSVGSGFEYYDIDGNVFSNSVQIIPSSEIPFGLTNISQSGNFFLPWTGEPLQMGEEIKVTISGGDQTTSRSWTLTNIGASHFILDENRLRDLVPGAAQIRIERTRSTSLEQSNLAGGRITSKYLSRKINIQITA